MKGDFKISGKVEKYPGLDGWYYIPVPKNITKMLLGKQNRGLIPITAHVEETTWQTSLLPKGDGTHFLALKKQIREKYDIKLGSNVTASFSLRF